MSRPALLSTAFLFRAFIVAFGLALFFEQAGARQLLHLEGSLGQPMLTLIYWASLLAPAFFLWALWAASGVLVRIERGDAFGPATVKGLKHIGAGLMLGALVLIVVQPSLLFLIANDFREMRGVKFAYDVENVTLALTGLVLVLIARQGEKLKSKLEQFV
jgi:hypothetical protein